jgi:excisionase family DNA binding protein
MDTQAQPEEMYGTPAMKGGRMTATATRHDETLDSIRETAAWTGLPVSWLYAQTAAKTIPHLKCGKYVRFRRSEVRAWLDGKRQGPSAEGRSE